MANIHPVGHPPGPGTPPQSTKSPGPTPPPSPGTQGLLDLQVLEGTQGPQSTWNGYKRMPPNVPEAIRQFNAATPLNIDGLVMGSPTERAQVLHDYGDGLLLTGRMVRGDGASVSVPPDIAWPTASVNVHSHPYTGQHRSDSASISDQIAARRNPQVQHIVQTPAPDAFAPNDYITYSGAFPPRHYTLVPNPRNLPVPPPSPDGVAPFHPYPD